MADISDELFEQISNCYKDYPDNYIHYHQEAERLYLTEDFINKINSISRNVLIKLVTKLSKHKSWFTKFMDSLIQSGYDTTIPLKNLFNNSIYDIFEICCTSCDPYNDCHKLLNYIRMIHDSTMNNKLLITSVKNSNKNNNLSDKDALKIIDEIRQISNVRMSQLEYLNNVIDIRKRIYKDEGTALMNNSNTNTEQAIIHFDEIYDMKNIIDHIKYTHDNTNVLLENINELDRKLESLKNTIENGNSNILNSVKTNTSQTRKDIKNLQYILLIVGFIILSCIYIK